MAKRLKLFRITGDLANLDRILERFVSFEFILPVESKTFTSSVHGLTSLSVDNPFEVVGQELEEIELDAECKIQATDFHTIDYSYENIRNYVHSTHERFRELNQHKKEAEELKKKYTDALVFVENIIELEISLDDIFSCEYVETRFGKLPIDSLETLKLYERKPMLFKTFKQEKKSCWCMYMATIPNIAEIDNIFSSVFFQRVYIPDFVQGKPEETKKSLLMEIGVMDEELKDIQNEIRDVIKENKDHLADIKGEIGFLNKIYAARKYVVDLGEKFNITGFLSDQIIDQFKSAFETIDNTEIEIMPADIDKRLKPPRKFKKSINR